MTLGIDVSRLFSDMMLVSFCLQVQKLLKYIFGKWHRANALLLPGHTQRDGLVFFCGENGVFIVISNLLLKTMKV